jgi:hypothetical protein
MNSVTEIETEIQKLSLAKQRMIALHLGERLTHQDHPGESSSPNEGIRSLATYEACSAPPDFRGEKIKPRTRSGS